MTKLRRCPPCFAPCSRAPLSAASLSGRRLAFGVSPPCNGPPSCRRIGNFPPQRRESPEGPVRPRPTDPQATSPARTLPPRKLLPLRRSACRVLRMTRRTACYASWRSASRQVADSRKRPLRSFLGGAGRAVTTRRDAAACAANARWMRAVKSASLRLVRSQRLRCEIANDWRDSMPRAQTHVKDEASLNDMFAKVVRA